MKKFLCLIFASSLVATCLFPVHADDTQDMESEPSYLIQPGDRIAVSVWKEQELQSIALVRPDGEISIPLVGDIRTTNRTIAQVREEITERLSQYIPDPVVTVAPQELAGNQIYVIGKVNRPGAFPINRFVDVVQALSIAGGMSPFAAANKIKVLRRMGGKEIVIDFKYEEIEKGINLEQNIVLQSGDVVVVP